MNGIINGRSGIMKQRIEKCPICGNNVKIYYECLNSHLYCECGLKFYGRTHDIDDIIDEFNNRKFKK
jgi:hypothetical protein